MSPILWSLLRTLWHSRIGRIWAPRKARRTIVQDTMIDITLELTGDPRVSISSAMELLQSPGRLSTHQRAKIADGVSLMYMTRPESVEDRHGLTYDAAPVFHFLVEMAENVGAGIVANYIYEKLKNNNKDGKLRLKINRRTIEFNEGEITRISEEEVKLKKR